MHILSHILYINIYIYIKHIPILSSFIFNLEENQMFSNTYYMHTGQPGWIKNFGYEIKAARGEHTVNDSTQTQQYDYRLPQ